MDAPHASARVLVVLGNAALFGQERGNIEVYRALQSEGVDSLFVTHAEWGGRQIEPYLDRLGLRSTPLAYAYHFRKGMSRKDVARNLRRLLAGSRAFWRVAREYRPTHIHVANPHYALCVLPALWLLRVPVVYRLGDVPSLHNAFYRALWRGGLIPLVWRFVCISAFVAQRAVAVGVPPRKVRVVLSAPPARPPHDESERPSDRDPDRRTVLFVGQVAEHKGVDLLVDAVGLLAERYPTVRIVVAGRVLQPYAQRLGARVLGAGLSQRIRFLGYVEDVESLFTDAAVHVCPSVCDEALGNVVLEAKRAGVPSVVFPRGGLPELVVEHGEDGVVCENETAEALAAGIEYYLAMPDDDLAAAGQAAADSLAVLGSDEATFRERWLAALSVRPAPARADAR